MPFKQEPFAYILAVTAVISSLVHCRVQNLPSSLHFSNSFMAATAVGSPEAYATEKENVLAKHVAFFDRNGDGIIHPSETYKGFRAIGCGIILSTASALFINLALSRKTLPPGKKLSLLFPIYISNISKCKHGSDSGVYDAEGRFVSEKFEEIFSKHAVAHRSTLTGKEMRTMLKANREDKDYGGWVGGLTEWEILYYLCKDKDGLIHKDTIRGVYDGSLFYQLEKKVAGHGNKVD